ncbi:MAG: hypothetical protein R2857_15490 [Vampirovibrionales bacterium]
MWSSRLATATTPCPSTSQQPPVPLANDDTFTLGDATGAKIQAGNGNNTVSVDDATNAKISSGKGTDTVNVTEFAENTKILTGAGADTINFNGGLNTPSLMPAKAMTRSRLPPTTVPLPKPTRLRPPAAGGYLLPNEEDFEYKSMTLNGRASNDKLELQGNRSDYTITAVRKKGGKKAFKIVDSKGQELLVQQH